MCRKNVYSHVKGEVKVISEVYKGLFIIRLESKYFHWIILPHRPPIHASYLSSEALPNYITSNMTLYHATRIATASHDLLYYCQSYYYILECI